MRRERISRGALAALLAVSLTGCGGQAGSQTPQAAEGFAPALDPQTRCVINVAGHYNNFESLEDEFNRFAEYYPNAELNYTYMDNYNGSIVPALSGDGAPDIFFVYPWMVGREEYQPLFDAAEDLADPSLGIDLSCIRQAILYTDGEGRVPMVPVFSSTYGMLVNEDIFEKEKIPVPRTYDQLLSACEALRKAGYPSPMMGHTRLLVYPLYFPYFCAGLQGDPEAVRALNEMGPGAGEYARDALELAEDFMERGYVDLEGCAQLENDYQAVILRFFEGDVPMMLASSGTVSGTEKRESLSESFQAHPFRYSFHPVPSTGEGGYFMDTVSMEFAVNRNSGDLPMVNEFMRFLVSADELGQMARMKRMVTPCNDMSLDGVYASFGELGADRIINVSQLGLGDTPDTQIRRAGNRVSIGSLTVDEAVAAFGTLE